MASGRTACRILSSTSVAVNPVSRKWNFDEGCNVSRKKPDGKFFWELCRRLCRLTLAPRVTNFGGLMSFGKPAE